MRTIDCLGSSNIDSIGYDPEAKELLVKFKNGAVYKYTNVAAETAGALEIASSKGAYLNQNIRPNHNCTRVT